MSSTQPHTQTGFTLIELSVVLVIIGLIIGGILTGQNLIDSAGQRAQIAQIEKYNTATHAFQGKYGGLPGDLPDPQASSFGFQPRGPNPGEGDGNGIIQGNCANTSGGASNNVQGCGEIAVLWEDLSEAGLIDAAICGYDVCGNDYPANTHTNGSGIKLNTTPAIKNWLPAAKLGTQNFVYILSMNNTFYFTVSSVDDLGWDIQSEGNPGLTVQQAYNIDKKMDDGMPQSGKVQTFYNNFDVTSNGNCLYAAGGLQEGAHQGANLCQSTTNATIWAATNCYDNNGTAGNQTYSVAKNATAQNCALSFQFE